MKIETAINKIQKEYERTKNLEFVRNPMAYALYQVWKEADKDLSLIHIYADWNEVRITLTVKDIADVLNVCDTVALNLVRSGEIPAKKEMCIRDRCLAAQQKPGTSCAPSM